MPIKDLTNWHVEGELWCPDCGLYFQFDGTDVELAQFIKDHGSTVCEVLADV